MEVVSAEEKTHHILEEPDVIFLHKKCQTKDVKCLRLDNIYEKLHRPNTYDIGGTYEQDQRHFWLTCHTDYTSGIFTLHIFVTNCDVTSFSLNMSDSSQFTVDRRANAIHLTKFLQTFQLTSKPNTCTYVTTYSFNETYVENLKNRKVYIPIKISTSDKENQDLETTNNIKASHDFGYLLTNPIGADYVIESSEGEKFQVHKLILAAHSKVFEAMFKEDNKLVYSEGDIMKQDVETDELKCFLEFMYTGCVNDIHNYNTLVLLHLADKYEVHGLRDLCEHVLCKQLSLDNALNTLVWSDLYNSQLLKTEALKFIKQHPMIIESSDFKQITNVDLIQEVCRYMITS